MLTDPERFKHFHSLYERPNEKYRCGREAKCELPCRLGPQRDGSCGGTTECHPFQNSNGRYECRRPPSAGGVCEHGPMPDGTCSRKHPPCVPMLSMRARRERIAIIFFAISVALLGGLFALSHVSSDMLSSIDPGPLSAKHANFVKEQGCVSCHAVHGLNAAGWLKSLFTKTDLSKQCLSCHTFSGPALEAHNRRFPERADLRQTSCVSCHTEHKGANFDIRTMTAQQCNSCHLAQFKSFSKGHPPFSDNYPHANRMPIQFDHESHLNRHFQSPKVAEDAPKDCLGCHAIASPSARHVTTGGFEENCTSCHNAEILKADLVLFRSPELFENTVDPQAVGEACGAVAGDLGGGEAGFVSISLEEPTVLSSFLLGVAVDDPDTYGAAMQQFMLAMARNDVRGISKFLKEHTSDPKSAQALLAGLDSALVKRAACAWLSNQEYEASSQAPVSGWHADYAELKYRPITHSDPIAKRWIEFVLAERQSNAEMMRREVLSQKRGVGKCAKCHSVSLETDASSAQAFQVGWEYAEPHERPYTYYSHGAHVDILGGGAQACMTCHALNTGTKYSESFKQFDATQFVSNFKGVQKETCLQCHGASHKTGLAKDAPRTLGEVREDCLLCHSYHASPTLKKGMVTHEAPMKKVGE
jgi:predicted CXXCH cytochrome family protein